MLLGDCPPEPTPSPPSATASSLATAATAIAIATATNPDPNPSPANEGEHPKGLDILHATSSALIHALRDVLLDSDFENAMKALTAWIPVQDEDLLMKVARAEWRRHQGGRRLWEGGWEWERSKTRGGGKEGGKGRTKTPPNGRRLERAYFDPATTSPDRRSSVRRR
jgi:hypothetical protein